LTTFRIFNSERLGLLQAFLRWHATRLRDAVRDKDHGASAIELAIITAVLVGLAVLILTIIYNFANKQATTITNHTIPGNGN
jgi:hypothetical protein